MRNINGGEWTPRSIAKSLSFSHPSRENIQCVMGYIVNLTVILDEIFRTATGNVSVMENAVLRVMVTHIKSDRRDGIHRDIRSFVSQASVNWAAAPPNDLVVEKVADLIR